jgi:signal transduction histidine kinase
LLSPTIDGKVSSFFEWRGAGTIDPSPPLGAMWRSRRLFSHIGFGYSLDQLFLRLDLHPEASVSELSQAELHVAAAEVRHKLVFSLRPTAADQLTLYSALEERAYAKSGQFNTIRNAAIIELAVPFKDLMLHAGQQFKLSLVVTEHGQELERYPHQQSVTLKVPDHNFDAIMWRV